MQRRRVLRGFAALAILSSVAVACGDDDDADQTSDTPITEPAEVQEIDVTAIDYSYSEVPTEIEAGLVTMNLSNEGTVMHEAALIEMGDAEQADFLARFTPAVNEGGPFPEEAQGVAAPVEVPAGETVSITFLVTEGKYLMLCTLTGDADDPDAEESDEVDPASMHMNKGMATPVTVNAGEAGELPDADGAITAADYTFDLDVEEGDESINFLNTGAEDQVHFGSLVQFPEGTSEEDALSTFAAFMSEEGPGEDNVEPSDDEFGFTGVYSKDLGGQFTVDGGVTPGTYVISCFISDRTGGPPHALPEAEGGHGMVKAFTIE
jgi:hypothetical protein